MQGHVVPLRHLLTQPCWCPALLDVLGSPAVFHFMEYLFFTRPSRCPIHMGLDNDGDKYDPPGVKVSSPGVKVSSPSGVAQCVAQGDQRDCGSWMYLAAMLSFISRNTISPGPAGAQPRWTYMAALLSLISWNTRLTRPSWSPARLDVDGSPAFTHFMESVS